MKISIHNYTEWMEAYMANRLLPADKELAEQLMLEHPAILDSYLAETEEVKLVADPSVSIDPALLLKNIVPVQNINAHNYLEYFVGSVEDTLSAQEKKSLYLFLEKNPGLQKEFQVMLACRLVPDTNIVFANKNELLHRPAPMIGLRWIGGIAAGILLLLGLFIFWPRENGNGNTMMVHDHLRIDSKVDGATREQIKNKKGPGIQGEENPADVYAEQQEKEKGTEKMRKNQAPYHKGTMNPDQNSSYAAVKKQELERSIQLETIPPEFLQADLYVKKKYEIYQNHPLNGDEVALINNRNKDLFTKVRKGQKTYVEDYVNMGFRTLKKKRDDEDKWVLKIERDEKGRSKGIKFASPLFSFKTKN